MELITTSMFLFNNFAVSVINFANSFASCTVFKNAPEPYFTSSTIEVAPEAIFLDTTDAQIKDLLSTVAVTSRSAYILPSAGVKFGLWDEIAAFISLI